MYTILYIPGIRALQTKVWLVVIAADFVYFLECINNIMVMCVLSVSMSHLIIESFNGTKVLLS